MRPRAWRVQHAATASGRGLGPLEQKGGLADARVDAKQGDGAGDDAAAQHAINLSKWQHDARRIGKIDVRQRLRMRNARAVSAVSPAPVDRPAFEVAVPFAALGAPAGPGGTLVGAVLAHVRRLGVGCRHGETPKVNVR